MNLDLNLSSFGDEQSAVGNQKIVQNQQIINANNQGSAKNALERLKALKADTFGSQVYPQAAMGGLTSNANNIGVNIVQSNNNIASINSGNNSQNSVNQQATNQSQVMINSNSSVNVITGGHRPIPHLPPEEPPVCPPPPEEPPVVPPPLPPVSPHLGSKIPCIVHDPQTGQPVRGADGQPIVQYYYVENRSGIIEHPTNEGNYYRLSQYDQSLNQLMQRGLPWENARLQAFNQIPVVSQAELSQMPDQPWPPGYFEYV